MLNRLLIALNELKGASLVNPAAVPKFFWEFG
jgi:hypothetical protein